jgi:DNA-binding LytR/AlgR family response regulator
MYTRRILIVEDDPMVALDLEGIVLGAAEGQAQVAVASSVSEARQVLSALPIDAAFLDIDVLDGKTFEVAELLHERGTPFAFVSGSRPEDVPPPLRSVPFLPKPYDPGDIERMLRSRLSR